MIKIHDIAYVRYAHHDLDEQCRFLVDFGLVPVSAEGDERFYRASGAGVSCYIDDLVAADQPVGLVAIGFTVPDRAMLDHAIGLPGSTGEIKALPAVFGGGHYAELFDPAGLRIELIHGAKPLPANQPAEPLIYNHSHTKLRFGQGQRSAYQAANVHRLGHAALQAPSVPDRANWYLETLGMLLSDALQEEDERVVAMFMRCDRGSEWTDHHTVAVFETVSANRVHHVSFEVPDMDALAVGSRWLARAGWTGEWGIGRHVLGSQIFDYWRDSGDCRIEHYCDGDLFTADKQAEYHPASLDMLYQWGPQVPENWRP